MHDLNEGVMPFLLNQLFSHCVDLKLFSKEKLAKIISNYDFGYLSSKTKPSILNLKKKNLGQNTAQSK